MTDCRVLALLPFLVKGARSIEIFRAMTTRRVDVTVAFAGRADGMYAADGMEDFLDRDRLIDVTGTAKAFELIGATIEDRRIDLVLQVGAASLYASFPLEESSRISESPTSSTTSSGIR